MDIFRVGKGWLRALLAVALVAAGQLSARSVEARLVKVADDAYAATSVNTAVFRASSVVSHGDEQFVAYYDGDGFVCLAKRRLGSSEWVVRRSPYRGNVSDAHNVISIAVDGNGFVHAAFDHHGGPLRYCRATEPYGLELGGLEPMVGTGEDDVTYPEFYALADGSLLFAYRSGASGRGNLVMNRYDPRSGRWSRVHDVLIDGEGERNAYWQIHVDAAGTIHLSWVWRESWLVETNHDLCYARSTDNGVTWTRSDGSPYELPVTAATAEYAWRIPQNSELINQTSMCADPSGNPYIATYWRDGGSLVPQYRVVWHDGDRWRMATVGERSMPFSLSGGGTKMIPISRPRMVTDGCRLLFLFRDEERGNRVSMAVGDMSAGGAAWRVCDLTGFSVDAWEPTIDTVLWNSRGWLHVYVQNSGQGDGERAVDRRPQPVYVLEVTP